MSAPVLELTDVSKAYGGLRPLRLRQLAVLAGERIALLGFDQPMAETFVNLVTGASLPDRGTVTVFGAPTSAISGSDEWLAFVDRFGIVSGRAAMLEGLSVLQNLAMPFTLEIEPMSDAMRAQAERLARDVHLPDNLWDARVADLDGAARASVRLARALALDPAILLLEHPTAAIDRGDTARWGSVVSAVSHGRGAAVVAVTADEAFGRALAGRTLQLDPATGRLNERGGGRWFRRS